MDEGEGSQALSGEAMELLKAGGLNIEVEGVVINSRWFVADGERVAKVTLLGSKGGPMGHGVQCHPYGIFEVDADYSVFEELHLVGAARHKFLADLKPISGNRHMLHLLKVLQ